MKSNITKSLIASAALSALFLLPSAHNAEARGGVFIGVGLPVGYVGAPYPYPYPYAYPYAYPAPVAYYPSPAYPVTYPAPAPYPAAAYPTQPAAPAPYYGAPNAR